MKAFKEMKVAELKQESRDRGLKLEHKGHKYTKAELIERLEAFEECGTVGTEEQDKTEPVKAEQTVQPAEVNKIPKAKFYTEETGIVMEHEDYTVPTARKIRFATTLEEIEERYGYRKNQSVYDNELQIGSFVAFIHYVEDKNGDIHKKLRTAKVVNINRTKELVRVETLLGTALEMSFSDLLYIKGKRQGSSYPMDINKYLKKQRTEKGRDLINERFGEKFATN